MHQPILVLFIYPGAIRHLEGRRPYPKRQSQPAYFVAQWADTVWELCGFGCGEFASGVLISLINVNVPIAEWLQMGGQPLRIGYRLSFIDGHVIRRPTPPAQ